VEIGGIMANRLELDYRLRLSNHHLSNIYDTGFYIEAGNLDTQKITKLIKKNYEVNKWRRIIFL